MSLRDSWRLAVGTLTALPVPAPARVDGAVARGSLLLAPLAVVPLGIGVAVVGWLTRAAELPPLAAGLLAVVLLSLGTRALHWDGLADVADGLTSSYDPARALEVMRSGSVGPAGAIAIFLVAGLQVVGLASLFSTPRGCLVAGIAVTLSRWGMLVPCLRGVPAARADGLGASFAGTVPWPAAAVAYLAAGLILWAGTGEPYAAAAVLAAAVVVGLLTARAVSRLGGVTGDVLGATVEIALATLVVCLA